jgi:hypothetical protein
MGSSTCIDRHREGLIRGERDTVDGVLRNQLADARDQDPQVMES